MNDSELTRVDDYEGALTRGKADYSQAKELFRTVIEKVVIISSVEYIDSMMKQLDYVVALGLIQSVKEWEEKLCSGHVRFLNDLFEDGNLEKYCQDNGVDVKWKRFHVNDSSLQKIELFLTKHNCFDNIAKLFITYNSAVYGINEYQHDDHLQNVAREFYSIVNKLTLYFCTLNPKKGFTMQNIQQTQQSFGDYYSQYFYGPSLMGVKYFFTDNSFEPQNIVLKPSNPNMDTDILNYYSSIVNIIKELASNSRFYKEVLHYEKGQDAFDILMLNVDMIIQLIIFKVVVTDRVLSSKEKELLKNSTLYGDLLNNLHFDIDWDDLYECYPESGEEIENIIDRAIGEAKIVDYFTDVVLPSIWLYLGTNTATTLKIALVGVTVVAAGASGRTGVDIMEELNTGTFMVNDYLWGKSQEKLRQLGFDVQI